MLAIISGPVSSAFEPVIGLEIHCQLLTASKIFCGCSTTFGSPPNTNICPVCLGLPGALPVLNQRAVELAVRAAHALGCTVHAVSIFARKNYFYPDLPKGYQISQYDRPLATAAPSSSRPAGGAAPRRHHPHPHGRGRRQVAARGLPDSASRTYLDFNRSGVPLIEIVTEPDLRSAAEAAEFFSAAPRHPRRHRGQRRQHGRGQPPLRRQRLGPAGRGEKLGVKTELKNLNSFRHVQRAIEYEVERQIGVIGRWTVDHETRLWDADAGRTMSMRGKEEAHDYRYFPEPDLPPLTLEPRGSRTCARSLPELPDARRRRFVEQYALPDYDASVLTSRASSPTTSKPRRPRRAIPKASSNWVMGALSAKMNDLGIAITEVPLTPDALAGLIRLIDAGTIGGPGHQGRVREDVHDRAARRRSSSARGWRGSTIRTRSSRGPGGARCQSAAGRAVPRRQAADVRLPRGQVMKATKGKANPALVNDLLTRLLERNGLNDRGPPGLQAAGRGVYALRELSLRVDKGEFVFLTGPSGAGSRRCSGCCCGRTCRRKASSSLAAAASRR